MIAYCYVLEYKNIHEFRKGKFFDVHWYRHENYTIEVTYHQSNRLVKINGIMNLAWYGPKYGEGISLPELAASRVHHVAAHFTASLPSITYNFLQFSINYFLYDTTDILGADSKDQTLTIYSHTFILYIPINKA